MLRLLLACGLAASVAAAPTSTSIYVSTSGDDSAGDGSIGAPFATPARAQRAARAVSGSGQKGDVMVILRGGLYALSETLTFTTADSAGNGYRVVYSAYAGDAQPPVLHGALPVTGWTRVDAARNLWSAPLPPGSGSARQAYINGRRMAPTNSAVGKWGAWALTDTGYVTSSAADCPPGWNDPLQAVSDIELRFTGSGSSWTECRVRVASIEALPGGACNVTMAQPAYELARNRPYGQGVQRPASMQNFASLLTSDTPGSAYANARTRTLYYIPLPSEDLTTAFTVVPGPVEVLVNVQGDTSGDVPVPVVGLSFENLTFAYAGWDEPSQPGSSGYVDQQSAFRNLAGVDNSNDDNWVPVPGNIQMHTVENVSVTGCSFAHLGMTALQIDDDSKAVTVANNTFVDVSCGGIYFGQVSDVNISALRANRDFFISNNLFDNIPAEYYDCAALLGGFVINTTISHNTILNNSNTGISLGWGWSRDEAVNAADNTISANYIFGSNSLLVDGGSIYVLGPQPNSNMIGNFISHQRNLYGALYTDEGSAYWYIAGNAVHSAPEWLHIWTASIHDELVELNWSDQTYQDVHGTNTTVRNNTFLDPATPFSGWPAEAQSVIESAGVLWMQGPKVW